MVRLRNVTKDDYSLKLELLEKFRQEKKFDKVSVTLFDDNDAARMLYEKAGFSLNGFAFEDEYDMELGI